MCPKLLKLFCCVLWDEAIFTKLFRKSSLTNGCGVLLANHLLHGDGPHDEVRALHYQPSFLMLPGVEQQAALVEECQPLGTVVTGHLDPQGPPVVVAGQAALQGKRIATLQTAVALRRKGRTT